MAQDEDKATGMDAEESALDAGDEAVLTQAEEIAASVASARPVRKAAAATDAEGKDRPTPKQARAVKAEKTKRTTPAQFVRESVDELRNVNWPSLDQWKQYFVVVLVFVLFIIGYVLVLETFFGWSLLQIFGA